MGLYIGNLGQNPTLPQAVRDIAYLNVKNAKIYGVTFDGVSHMGRRLYDAVGMKWEPSSESYEGVDDFTMADNGNSPFHVRKCVLVWNDNTELFDVTYEDTDKSTYDSLIANRTGIRMVAFPKFYFKRPNEWTFLVSSSPIPGFTISPMHYRQRVLGGPYVEDDYCYIGEYDINTNGDMSQPGYNPRCNTTMDTFRSLSKAQHCFITDYASRVMVSFLATIKYADLNTQLCCGYGCNSGNCTQVMTDSIKGLDGYRASLTGNSNIRCMGLLDYWGNAWNFMEGVCTWNTDLYYTNNIEAITTYPTTLAEASAMEWNKTVTFTAVGGGASFSRFVYDTNYPFVMAPGASGGDYTNPIGDGSWHANNNFSCVLVGGGGWDGSADGLWCWASNAVLSVSDVSYSARVLVPGVLSSAK